MKQHFLIPALVGAAAAWSQPLTPDQALRTAFARRSVVASAELALERERHIAAASGAYPGPTLGVGQSSRPGLGATDQDLFVSQPIDLFGRLAASRRSGRALVQVAEAERRQTLLTVQGEVLQTFFEAAAAARLSKVAEDLVTIAESVHNATVRRFEEGKVAEVQVIRAKLELDRTNQSALMRQSQLAAALSRLAGAMGVEALSGTIKADAQLADPETSLSSRPELMRLAAQVRVAEADAGLASKALLPELELIGMQTPWREQPPAYGARLQLVWQPFDFGKVRSSRSAAQRQTDSARAALKDATLRAQAELASIDLEIAASSRRVQSYEAIRLVSLDLVEKSQRGLSEGVGTLSDVLDATRALREIEQELAEAQLDLSVALAAKYQAAGTLMEVTP